MTREEAIAYGKRVIDLGLNDETQEFCQMAIKALKQYGVLQEIRTEIEKPLREERYFVTANAKAQYIALNWVYGLIDKHIKEIEE